MPPMRLMTALPSERMSLGVRSGMSATTGALQSDMTKTKRMMKNIVSGSEPTFIATIGIIAKRIAEIGAPKITYGRRLPKREWVLSESLPKVGWKMTPKILSNVMMIPMNSGTSVMPPAAVVTFSPFAAANSARAGNAALSFADHEVIVALLLSRWLSILVM